MPKNFFIDSKNNGPVVVLLHGLLSSRFYWTGLQAFLDKLGYRTISIDALGFGDSPKPRNIDYNYDDHVDFVMNTLKSLGIENNITFVGHSTGSLIAARIAIKYQSMVDRSILLNPPIFTSRESAHLALRSVSNLYRFILDSKYRGPLWLILRLLSRGMISKHTKRSREKTIHNVIETAEFIDDINKINSPVLIVNGLEDRPEYHENLIYIDKRQNITINEIKSAHHPAVYNLDLIKPIIADYLQQPPSMIR